ncbi:MAG: hypothetical protein H7X91_03510 [Burkholderiales bacterium]|nr:hypothetical protein [Burkholderiales bacterium]
MKLVSRTAPRGSEPRDRRGNRAVNSIASPITLEYRGKLYRGYFTLAGNLLVVSCGAVSKSTEARRGQLELQARQVLMQLAQAAKLHQYGSPI